MRRVSEGTRMQAVGEAQLAPRRNASSQERRSSRGQDRQGGKRGTSVPCGRSLSGLQRRSCQDSKKAPHLVSVKHQADPAGWDASYYKEGLSPCLLILLPLGHFRLSSLIRIPGLRLAGSVVPGRRWMRGRGGRSPHRLAHRTLLPTRRKAGVPNPLGPVVLTLKPKVGRGKAVVSVNPIPLVEPDRRPLVDGLTPEQLEARSQINRKRSVMRSRGLLMDYAQEYGLGYLWTLTWAPDAEGKGQSDWPAMVAQVRRFQERLSQAFPGMPYVIVPEWHPGGYGIHLHMGVGQFIDYRVLNTLWTHGATYSPRSKKWRGKVPAGDCARYLAKYVSKTLGVAGLVGKRFWRPHGQAVTIVRHRFGSTVEAEGYAVWFFGGELPAATWSSEDAEDWSGPPVTVLDWNAHPGQGGKRSGRQTS